MTPSGTGTTAGRAAPAGAAPPAVRRGWLTLFAPLGGRPFRLLWACLVISLVGDGFQAVALPVLVLDLTGRPGAVGAVLAAEAVPRVALLLGGGLLIDRYGARAVMLASALLSGAVVALLAALTGGGAVAVWHLYVVAATLGAAAALFLPAASAIIPELVPAGQVRSANALRTLAFNAARVAGPLLAGVAIAAAGPAAAFWANAASFFGAAACLVPLRAPAAARGRAASVLGGLAEGVRTLRRDAVVWHIFVIVVVWNLGHVGATFVGIPVLATLALGGGERGVGLLFGAYGAGALLGSLLAGGAPSVPRPGAVFCLGTAGTGLAMAAAGLAPGLGAAAACLALAGACVGVCPVIGWTLVQTRTPAAVRGRTIAMITLGIAGLQPASLALAGAAGEALGPRALLVAGGVIPLLAGLSSRASLRRVEWT